MTFSYRKDILGSFLCKTCLSKRSIATSTQNELEGKVSINSDIMVSTRKHKYGYEDQGEKLRNYVKGSMCHDALMPTLLDQRKKWANFLRRGHYQPVIAEVLTNELPKYANSNTVLPPKLSSIMRECTNILASASSVFHAAVDGTSRSAFSPTQNCCESILRYSRGLTSNPQYTFICSRTSTGFRLPRISTRISGAYCSDTWTSRVLTMS